LQVHLRQFLLHALNAPGGIGDVLLPLPPQCPHHADFVFRPEGVLQQPVHVQFQ
jgi:hypothetical protein